MEKEIADKWVAALRSGKYKQGTQKLCHVNGKNVKYCCLGVLCHILGTPYKKDGNHKEYEDQEFSVPLSVQHKIGMKSGYGNITDSTLKDTNLADLNDHGKSFKEIADIIERNWESL